MTSTPHASASPPTSPPDDIIEIGRVLGAYGIKGAIKVQAFSQDAATLLHAKKWWMTSPQHKTPYRLDVKTAKVHSDTIVATFDQIADRTAAEGLKSHRIWVSRAEFPRTQDDEYYWVDLIGCDVLTDAHAAQPDGFIKLGVVQEVLDNVAHAVLSVRLQHQDEQGQWVDQQDAKGRPLLTMIPFVAAHVTDVNLESRCIQTNWPLDF